MEARSQAEFSGAAFDELDDMLGIAGDIITHPELCATMFWLDGELEAVRRRIFGGIVVRQSVVEIECASGVFGGAYVEQAGKVHVIVGHDGLRT